MFPKQPIVTENEIQVCFGALVFVQANLKGVKKRGGIQFAICSYSFQPGIIKVFGSNPFKNFAIAKYLRITSTFCRGSQPASCWWFLLAVVLGILQ
jgi:hypothetical protein